MATPSPGKRKAPEISAEIGADTRPTRKRPAAAIAAEAETEAEAEAEAENESGEEDEEEEEEEEGPEEGSFGVAEPVELDHHPNKIRRVGEPGAGAQIAVAEEEAAALACDFCGTQAEDFALING